MHSLKIEDYLESKSSNDGVAVGGKRETPRDAMPFPYIGTDESGKGDYFGPLGVAAVWVDEGISRALENLGVRDSKQLTDMRCQDLAPKIRELCKGRFYEVEIPPDKYNTLYEQFVREKKTLNHLLAWGHARAIEDLLARQTSKYA